MAIFQFAICMFTRPGTVAGSPMAGDLRVFVVGWSLQLTQVILIDIVWLKVCGIRWMFPNMGVPNVSQCHHPFEIGIFHCKPSSYWGYPDDYGNLQIEPVTRGVVLISSGTHSMQIKVTIDDNYDLLLKTLLVSLVKSLLPILGLSENIANKPKLQNVYLNQMNMNELKKYAKCSPIDR